VPADAAESQPIESCHKDAAETGGPRRSHHRSLFISLHTTHSGDRSMRNSLVALVMTVILFPIIGCNEGKSSKPPTTTAARSANASSEKHAPSHATPGSHEDWCGEHQVPESMCTQCNPSLVAAFKATGDWCEEHGLPESQCRICNPNLKIERPPQKAGQ
jgi:hypothetical protein